LSYVGVFLGAIATIGLLGLGVTAGPFEQLLWGGKWTSAVRPIQLLALAMPLHLASMVVEMLAQSQGRFRLWTAAVFVRGVGFGVAAFLAGWLGGARDPSFVAGVMSLYIAVRVGCVGDRTFSIHGSTLHLRGVTGFADDVHRLGQ